MIELINYSLLTNLQFVQHIVCTITIRISCINYSLLRVMSSNLFVCAIQFAHTTRINIIDMQKYDNLFNRISAFTTRI